MKSTRFSFFFNFALTLALLIGAAGLMFSQNSGQPAPDKQNDKQPQAKGFGKQKAPERPGSMEKIVVHGKSLEGNLEGDSPDRDVFVYLPLSYTKNRNQRYPVMYFLHGYGAHAEAYTNLMWASDAADKTAAAGTSKEMILVFPDSYTIYNGSMYSNSPTPAAWETFITQDLINYIDSHYRTIGSRESRGLAGHSMGGYGTMRIGMKYPEVFSAIYALSPCCMIPNMNPAPSKAEGIHTMEDFNKADFGTKAQFASAAVWSPNPKNPPFF